MADVEDDVTINIVSILESLPNLYDVFPSNIFYDLDPCSDLGSGIFVSAGCIGQMLPVTTSM
jgi:hypothetical protein